MRIWLTVAFAAIYTPVWAAMPAAEQNALVTKYCAVCHTDAAMSGGLSFQHYDAAKRDPDLAAMILSKLNNGAMGAAGNGVPDIRWRSRLGLIPQGTRQSGPRNGLLAVRTDGCLLASYVKCRRESLVQRMSRFTA
jgi:hypothetical protein